MYGYGAGETGKNRFCGEGQLRRCGSTEGSQPFVPGCRGGSALLGSRGNAHWRVEGSQPHRVKGETPCPGKVDACVNLYWVLPDAKLRRSGGFAALPSPEHLCRKEEKYLKLTRHNGRSGKHGTYNPRHNDRRFDVENSEHIDAERARQNVYWDCYRGFTTTTFGKTQSSRISALRKLNGCITTSIMPTMSMLRTPGTRKPGTLSAIAL